MSSAPSMVQVMAAVEMLRAAGWTFRPAAADDLKLVTVAELAALLAVGTKKARQIAGELPHTVHLPGGDIRVRLVDVVAYLDRHPLRIQLEVAA